MKQDDIDWEATLYGLLQLLEHNSVQVAEQQEARVFGPGAKRELMEILSPEQRKAMAGLIENARRESIARTCREYRKWCQGQTRILWPTRSETRSSRLRLVKGKGKNGARCAKVEK